MTLITLDDLSRAIAQKLDMEWEEAKKFASLVIDFFGFEDRILDNILDPEERKLFYLLEKQNILSCEREETTLHNGNEWRIHYWRLEKTTILHHSNGKNYDSIAAQRKESTRNADYENLYSTIPKDMWKTRKIPNM